jgi:signal peptidase I
MAAPDVTARARPRSVLVTLARESAGTAALAAVLTLVLQRAVQPRLVEGGSMEPTLHTSQRVLVSPLAYRLLGQLHRGDVVVFDAWGDEPDYIKRVIGVPGETVELRDGVVYVDGRVLVEPYVTARSSDSCGPVMLGEREYFVLGDNRPNSADSRTFGPLAADQIVGPALVSLWPPGRIDSGAA